MSVHDTQNETTRQSALDAAVDAVREGRLIVLPTDTVYGIGADAFSPQAVDALLEAKGRGRETPPPVLIGDPAVLMALAVDVPEVAERLAEAFWPGPLTLILTAQPSLSWDLGETRGTVALRMPEDDVALELLRATGPLAVSSANRHGRPAALSVLDAATQLGDSVEIYLDGGPARIGTSSTIIDATVEPPEIVREGALTREQIVAELGDIFTAPEPEEADEESAADESAGKQPAADDQSAASESAADDESTDGERTDDERTDDERQQDSASVDSTEDGAAAPALDLPSEPDLEDLSGQEPMLGEAPLPEQDGAAPEQAAAETAPGLGTTSATAEERGTGSV